MDYLTKRIQEKLLARGRAEQARADEWRRSLKPTVYRGNNLFQEMGGEPLEGRYLGQQGLVPGQSVPNIGRNPNKPVIPGVPVSHVSVASETSFYLFQKNDYQSIINTVNDYPGSPSQSNRVIVDNPSPWYPFENSGGFNTIWKEPFGVIVAPSTGSFTQTIDVSDIVPGLLRLVTSGADDNATVVISFGNTSVSHSWSFLGVGVVFDWIKLDAFVSTIQIAASVENTITGGAGLGFRLEFAPAKIITVED